MDSNTTSIHSVFFGDAVAATANPCRISLPNTKLMYEDITSHAPLNLCQYNHSHPNHTLLGNEALAWDRGYQFLDVVATEIQDGYVRREAVES